MSLIPDDEWEGKVLEWIGIAFGCSIWAIVCFCAIKHIMCF